MHLFQAAEEWNEPYIKEVDQTDYEVDKLFEEGVAKGVIHPYGTGQFIYQHPREEVRSLFRDDHGREKGLGPTDFQHTLRRHGILAREIFEDIVEKIIANEGRDLEAKIRGGAYPPFLEKALETYLGEC